MAQRPPWHLSVTRLRHDSLLRSSIYIMASQVIVATVGFVFWIVAARMYSVSDVGLASALLGVMTFVSMASLLGVATALVQELSGRQSSYLWSLMVNAGFATVIVTGLLVSAAVAVALPWFSPQFTTMGHDVAYSLAFVAGVQLWSLATVLDGIFVAERAAGYMLARGTIFALLRIPLVVLPVLVAPAGALAIVCAWVLATAVSLFAGWLLLLHRFKREYRLVIHGIIREIRSMLPAYIGHHLINLGYFIPILLLPLIVTTRLSAMDNAYFYVTWQIGISLFTISLAVATSLLAEGSFNSKDLRKKVRSSALIIGVLYGLAFPAILWGGPLILALVGPAYVRYGLPLLILLLAAAVPTAITNVCITVLRLQRRLHTGAALSLGIGMLTLALSWELLPIMGIMGADIAWLIAQTAGCLMIGAFITVSHVRKPQRGARPKSTNRKNDDLDEAGINWRTSSEQGAHR